MTELDELQLRVERAKREIRKRLNDIEEYEEQMLAFGITPHFAYCKTILKAILAILEGRND